MFYTVEETAVVFFCFNEVDLVLTCTSTLRKNNIGNTIKFLTKSYHTCKEDRNRLAHSRKEKSTQ